MQASTSASKLTGCRMRITVPHLNPLDYEGQQYVNAPGPNAPPPQ